MLPTLNPQPTEQLFPRGAISLICTAMLLIVSGCGPTRARPVNVELAKSTLIDVLDHWKSGGSMDELQSSSPEIVVQDASWTKGQQLQDYQLIGDGKAEDANWFCEVELTFKASGGGGKSKKTVTYVVGTDPVLTVFRAIL